MIYQKGQIYHLYNRGCNRENIFYDKTDYEKLMFYIKSSNFREYFKLYAFSLMPNHYHFFLKQISEKPVSKWFQYIFNRYVQYFNKKYERTGTIFEGNLKSRIITNRKYLSLIPHYIHANPKTVLQKEYSSFTKLYDSSLIDQEFYIKHFGSIKDYFISFEEFMKEKNKEIPSEWLQTFGMVKEQQKSPF